MLCKKENVHIAFMIYIIIIVLFLIGIGFCHVSSLEYRSAFLFPFYLIGYAALVCLIGCSIHNIPTKKIPQSDDYFILEPCINRLCDTISLLVARFAKREENEVWVFAINENRIFRKSTILLCRAQGVNFHEAV